MKSTIMAPYPIAYRVSENSETNENFIYYLLFALFALYVHPDITHFLSRFTMFVLILLNILRLTEAQ
jgi:hypothetical protein